MMREKSALAEFSCSIFVFRRFTMGVIDIICGIVLILASIMVIILVSMQESKRGMSALTGGQSEAVNRNYGRTRDAMLVKGTKILTAIFFALTIIVSIIDKFTA